MKLNKEFYSDAKNAKHLLKGALRTMVSGLCKEYFSVGVSSGEIYMVDSELDSRWFSKLDNLISDWEKRDNMVWTSSFSKSVKFHNKLDKTTYIIYRKSA